MLKMVLLFSKENLPKKIYLNNRALANPKGQNSNSKKSMLKAGQIKEKPIIHITAHFPLASH